MSNELKIPNSNSLAFALVLFATIPSLYSLHHASARYLEPVYGNVFPYLYLDEASTTCFILGLTIGLSVDGMNRRVGGRIKFLATLFNFGAVVMALAPLVVDQLFTFSSKWGPLWGPHITQLPLLYCNTLLLGAAVSVSAIQWINDQRNLMQFTQPAMSLCLGFVTCQFLQPSLPSLSSCNLILLNSVALGIAGFLLNFFRSAVSEKSNRITSWFRILLPPTLISAALIYTTTKSHHCGNSNISQSSLKLSSPWRILDRTESITGWVEVVEETQRMNMRVMRSGHSILGGRYRNTGDSIFATFHLLEAVRVFDRPGPVDDTFSALQIGLGCGISTNALLSQGIEVHVVELDPAVYYMARDYFGLMKPTSVHLESGRTFLENSASHVYDFVLHDIFTGGSVAPGMFSTQVLVLIKNSLKSNGILAMNFVGSEQPQYREGLDMIATTLKTVFQHVKCYRDTEDSSVKFTNYMFLAADFPLSFHTSPDATSAFSKRTTQVLGKLDKLTVNINDSVPGGIITDKSLNKLKALGVDAAKEHWFVMRQIFGDDFWLSF